MMRQLRYEAVVVGASAGGTTAMAALVAMLPASFPLPIVVVQHVHPLQKSAAMIHYNNRCALTIEEAVQGEQIETGHVYFAPANYHLLIENDRTFSISIDPRVNYARPSIDVLFESAADAYGPYLIGIILTGANDDGAQGLRLIKERGGLVVVQDPTTAEVAYMPRAAIAATEVDYVLPIDEIGALLHEKGKEERV